MTDSSNPPTARQIYNQKMNNMTLDSDAKHVSMRFLIPAPSGDRIHALLSKDPDLLTVKDLTDPQGKDATAFADFLDKHLPQVDKVKAIFCLVADFDKAALQEVTSILRYFVVSARNCEIETVVETVRDGDGPVEDVEMDLDAVSGKIDEAFKRVVAEKKWKFEFVDAVARAVTGPK